VGRSSVINPEQVAARILVIRGEKVLLDADLAELYGVNTSRFNEAVKRNLARFPADFMFQLSNQEFRNLISQFAISSSPPAWGGRRHPPYAFTEHGAIMAATILNTAHATTVSVYVVRAFVQLRGLLSAHKELAQKLDQLEARMDKKFATHDQAIVDILAAIRELMTPNEPPKKRKIGFVQGD
jgi:hypothetical protein